MQAIARRYRTRSDFLFLGRGTNYPIALEGALKLKEISYIHAEGYAAGEMKHGPIALIDDGVPVVVLAPTGPGLREGAVEPGRGARARGQGHRHRDQRRHGDRRRSPSVVLTIPDAPRALQPILTVLPLQLLRLLRRDWPRAPTSTSRATWPRPSPSSERPRSRERSPAYRPNMQLPLLML